MTVHARSVKKIPGMGSGNSGGKLYDYRGTGLLHPNGGRIRVLTFTHHIPVMHQERGARDFIDLAGVLRARGLAVQSSTDAEGNVCLFTRMDELCYHARGANSFSTGSEHMHFALGEPWTERQHRAVALLAARAFRDYGVPLHRAVLSHVGPGQCGVVQRGHHSHQYEADVAGWRDRSDPGVGLHYGHVYDLAHFYLRHHRF